MDSPPKLAPKAPVLGAFGANFSGFAALGSPLVVVTDRHQAAAGGRTLLDIVAEAVAGGARVVLLREKDLPRDARAHLARGLQELLQPVGGTLLVASDTPLARSIGAAGVHLSASDPPPVARPAPVDEDLGGDPPPAHDPPAAGGLAPVGDGPAVGADGSADSPAGVSGGLAVTEGAAGPASAGRDRPPDDADLRFGRRVGAQSFLVGRSCHSVEELVAARGEGCDYVTLSPVWSTPSKPGYGPALGLDGLAAACARVPELPVVALGGIEPERVADVLAAGAAAVAVMGAIMRADDPALVVGRILKVAAP